MIDPRSSILITVDELETQILGKARLVILDVSDDLETAPLERPALPGAIAVSLASDMSGPPTKLGGRRPLPDGCFKPAKALRALFAGLGADGSQPVGVYCGSGNASSHGLAAMYAVGIEAPLYVGSWSAWTGDPSRPVAQGPERG